MTPVRPGCAALAAAMLSLFLSACVGQAQQETYRAPRTPHGTPDLGGIWQANNTANWDLEPHTARMGPVVALAAAFSVPPGLGVVEGGEIPYLPAALEKRNANRADWVKLDPEVKCYMPGIPRATYMPYPFQIVQSADTILFTYEYASTSRIVRVNTQEKSPAPAWMGWSVGKWDGESLVVDNDGIHGARERSGPVALRKGFHPLRVAYFNAGGTGVLAAEISGPGLPRRRLDLHRGGASACRRLGL